MVLPFSIKWSAEWKTMHDIHQLQKVSGPVTKLAWLFGGVAVGVGLSYAPAMLVQKIRGKKKDGEVEAEGAAPKAAPKRASAAKAAAAPAESAASASGEAAA